jgi:DNA-binding winged helix-turn-helix (wHTH) protein/tetratricopeptide (TPR) repeat protein
MRAPRPERVLRFDAFTLDLSRCVVLRGEVVVPLRRQAFDMLRYLAERAGRLVSKEELIGAIWHRPDVSDDSLVKCIRDIRDALGDHDQRIIETVRGRGYLLATDVQELASPTSPPPVIEPDAAASHHARSRWFQVAGAQYSVRHLAFIAGSLAVAVAIGAWVFWAPTPAEPAPHHRAAHYAVLGRAVLDREHTAAANKEALALFDKALALNPDSKLALLGYARVMIVDVTDGWAPPEERAARLDQAEAAIERAIKLDPKHAPAYLQRGFLWRARADPDRALAAFQHALALTPNDAWAHAEAARAKIDVGRAAEAVGDIQTAIRLASSEPRLFNWYYWLGMAAVHAGKSDIAVDWLLKGPKDNTLFYRFATPWLAVAYAEVGREDQGRALIAEYLSRHPSYGITGWRKAFPGHNPVVAEQRERIARVLRRLGVPDGRVQTGSAR